MWAAEELRFLGQLREATDQSLKGVIGARAAADEARLIYSDYLDELGDSRGEYLRNELAFAQSLRDGDLMAGFAQTLLKASSEIYRKQRTTLDYIVLRRWLQQVSIPFHVVVMSYGSYRNHVVQVILRYQETDWFAVHRELTDNQPIICNANWSVAWKALKQIHHPVKDLGEGLELTDAPQARLVRADCKLTN